MCVFICVWRSVYVCVHVRVYCLQQGAVAAARSAARVLVGELHPSAVALALPQAGGLDDLLHQLLKRTLDAVTGLGARLWEDSVNREWQQKAKRLE